jgi:hypothetical protein
VTALCLLGYSDSAAIIIRHDREDRQYIAIGDGYPAVGTMLPVGDGVATLIAPQWAITAAHVAENISPFSSFVSFDGHDHEVERVFYHPTWRGLDDFNPEDGGTVDVALLKLGAPVAGIDPIGLYRNSDEEGKRITFVGWGETGSGLSGPEGADGRRRGARNVVSSVNHDWIYFLFDTPPEGDDLEGISGPGDSGGPALLQADGQLFILGVGSSNDDFGQGIPTCTYGTTEIYARVSAHREWIEETMKTGEGGETFATVAQLRGGHWPDTPAGRVAAAFFTAYAAGEDAPLETFESTYRTAEALETRSVKERIAGWSEYRDTWGDLKADRYADSGADDISVLVYATGSEEWLNFRFLLRETAPPKLRYIGIGNAAPPRAGS